MKAMPDSYMKGPGGLGIKPNRMLFTDVDEFRQLYNQDVWQFDIFLFYVRSLEKGFKED